MNRKLLLLGIGMLLAASCTKETEPLLPEDKNRPDGRPGLFPHPRMLSATQSGPQLPDSR